MRLMDLDESGALLQWGTAFLYNRKGSIKDKKVFLVLPYIIHAFYSFAFSMEKSNSTTSDISQLSISQISCNVFKVMLLFFLKASKVPVLK